MTLLHMGAVGCARAQSVSGTLIASDTGEPVEGAMLHLLDSSGATVGSRLSDAAGRFLLLAPAPGTYTVRADRIGHASTFSDPLMLTGSESVAVELRAAVQVIQLEGIHVQSDKRCVARPAEGEVTDRVWNEARKALEAARWSDEHGIYQYKIRHFERKLDADARRIEEESMRLDGGWRKRTFTSLPAHVLADSGYVRPDGDGYVYNAPDADVLLSDAFLDSHCFRVQMGDDEDDGLVGLEFRPLRERRTADIAGTFWLDAHTMELRRIDYRYVNLGRSPYSGLDIAGLDLRNIGGRVEFQRLPSGPWVVQRWEIRMPLLGARVGDGRRTAFLAGIQQRGAEVVRIEDNRRRVVLEAATATIAGSVLGEFNVPVAHVPVRLVGTGYAATTDTSGSFRIPGVLAGTYEVTYDHPVLDSLGYAPDPVLVDAGAGLVSAVRFRVPSRWDVLSESCAETTPGDGTAAVLGYLRETPSGIPLEGARIQVRWSDWDMRAQQSYRVEEGVWTLEVTSDARGFFLACGVPVNHPVSIRATYGPFETQEALRVPADALSHHVQMELDVRASRATVDTAAGRTDGARTARSGEPDADFTNLIALLRRESGPSVRVSDYGRGGTGMGFCVESPRRRPSIHGEDTFNGCRSAGVLMDGQPLQNASGKISVSATELLRDIPPGQFESVRFRSSTR